MDSFEQKIATVQPLIILISEVVDALSFIGINKLIDILFFERRCQIMSNILYVGIDVSKNTNVVCIMLPNGKKYDEFSIDNSLYGARLIAKSVVQVLNW